MIDSYVSRYSLLKREPTEDQKEAIEVLSVRDRYLLADSTGLGKTYTVLSSYVVIKDRYREGEGKPPILFVSCPRAAVPSWKREVSEYTGLSLGLFTTENKEEDGGLVEGD